MGVVGNMAKMGNDRPGEYEFKEFQAEFNATANLLGEVYLIIGTDSGFESTTSYYLDDISITWDEAAAQPIVTRAQAAQMLFDIAERPSADPAHCPFQDVAVDNPNIEAITWAQEHGYSGGYGDGRFGPEDGMTVEQTMVMIYRFFGSSKADLSVPDHFQDGSQVSFWAKEAVAWAIAGEVFQPKELIAPQALITAEELTACLGQIAVRR